MANLEQISVEQKSEQILMQESLQNAYVSAREKRDYASCAEIRRTIRLLNAHQQLTRMEERTNPDDLRTMTKYQILHLALNGVDWTLRFIVEMDELNILPFEIQAELEALVNCE